LSWEEPLSGIKDLIVPLPQRVDFTIYRALREGVPVIDAAIRELKRLVGTFGIESDEETKAEVESFLTNIPILGTRQTGFQNFLSLHLDSLLLFGKAAAEIVLTNDRDGVYGLKPIPVETIRLVAGENGDLRIAQQQPQGLVVLPDDLVFYNVLSPQDNRPHGTSLLASLAFVADIWLKMAWSLGKTWERFGTPTFHVNWLPDENFRDPSGSQTQRILDQVESQFVDAMESRRDLSSTKDFFSAGKISVDVLGAQGQALNFEVPHRAIMEQIVSVTGLPPWWLGFSWSTTERLSQQQADKIVGNINSWREELTPDISHLISLHLLLRGQPPARPVGAELVSAPEMNSGHAPGEHTSCSPTPAGPHPALPKRLSTPPWSLRWNDVSLLDRADSALADWREAITAGRRWETAKDLWANGIISQLDAARTLFPSLHSPPPARPPPPRTRPSTRDSRLPNSPSPSGAA
jgi:hypothetical protein